MSADVELRARLRCVMKEGEGEGRTFEGDPTSVNAGDDGTWLRLLNCDGPFKDRLVRLESCARVELVADPEAPQ